MSLRSPRKTVAMTRRHAAKSSDEKGRHGLQAAAAPPSVSESPNSVPKHFDFCSSASFTSNTTHPPRPRHPATMISDASLYSLAVFLGSAAMLLIVFYHFLEINSKEDGKPVVSGERKADAIPQKAR
ncbi:hypothetical protein LTR42_007670 [Elasticomyces elasticus]|nr:hypothetical protein LTR42_007670 [Elasticomyces elasticus]